MAWLIRTIGEERALGTANVVRLQGGGTLLTNPSGMVKWMLPFWLLGSAQISAAVTLVWLWAGRRAR